MTWIRRGLPRTTGRVFGRRRRASSRSRMGARVLPFQSRLFRPPGCTGGGVQLVGSQRSVCVGFQGVTRSIRIPHLCSTSGCEVHGFPLRTRVLSMVSSFRMQAVITTLNGLPIFSLQRLAVSAAMYNDVRSLLRPPRMRRWPRNLPLSWLNGASPAKEAISCRLRRPSSGSCRERFR
jgi:hypothetical protein